MNPVTIRASSFGSLFDCPSRWVAIHIMKKHTPSSPKSLLGTAIHKSTGVFDKAVLDGSPLSADDAVGAGVDAIYRPDQDIAWDDEQFPTPQKVEGVVRSLHGKYCKEIAPKQNYVAVEVSVDSLHLTDLGIILTGTTDRIYQTEHGDKGIKDIKTGKTAVGTDGKAKTKGHGAQLGVYEIVAEHGAGVKITAPAAIIGLQTNLKPETQRIGEGLIEGARDVLIGEPDSPGLLSIAADIVHNRIPAWGNPKSMMCHPRYCPNYQFCKWRK